MKDTETNQGRSGRCALRRTTIAHDQRRDKSADVWRSVLAARAHDPRFDGIFFIGIITTRIRCRLELAPWRAPVDAVSRLAFAAALRIGAGALNGRSGGESSTSASGICGVRSSAKSA